MSAEEQQLKAEQPEPEEDAAQQKPNTILAFPRHALDVSYSYAKLKWLEDRYAVSEAAFREAHRSVSEPTLEHHRRRVRDRRRGRAR